MLDKDKNSEKEKAKARIMSDISRLKTVSSAEAKSILAGIRNDIAGFPDLAYLAEIAAEYVRNLEIKENSANNPSVQQIQTAINKNLWDIIEKEKEIMPIKAAVEKEHAEIDNLYNQSKSKDIKVASQAMEEMLKRNSPEQIDSFAQNAVKVAEKRKEQLRSFEEIQRLNGGELDGGLKKQYEALNTIDTKEKEEFASNIGKRLIVQVASDLAKELEKDGSITKEMDEDKKHYNAVRVQRIIEEDQAAKAVFAQEGKNVAKVTYDNPEVGNACSTAFSDAKDRVKSAIDRVKFSQEINAQKAQEKPLAVSDIQAASNEKQHRASETTHTNQIPKKVLAQEGKKIPTASLEQPGNTQREASSAEKSSSSIVLSKQQQEIERMKKAKEAAKSAGIIDGLKPKSKTTDLTSTNPSVQTGKLSHADIVKQGRSTSSKDTTFSR